MNAETNCKVNAIERSIVYMTFLLSLCSYSKDFSITFERQFYTFCSWSVVSDGSVNVHDVNLEMIACNPQCIQFYLVSGCYDCYVRCTQSKNTFFTALFC